MRILCAHIETSSLWADFVNKNRCICVRSVSEEVESFNFDNFENLHNSFLWPEYFIDFLCERWIPCQAVTSVLFLPFRPKTVHCSTKNAYTIEITFLALVPWVWAALNLFTFLSETAVHLVCKQSFENILSATWSKMRRISHKFAVFAWIH